ncbi:MAG: hypothetical protein SOU50_03405 [Oscillospiraceae bacterium]|nr:hypothetical protein [Oscillospiraceae bacterium]
MTEAVTANVRVAKKPSAAVHYGKMLAKRNMKYAVLALFMNFLGLPLFLIHLISECVIAKNTDALALAQYDSVFDAPNDTIYIIIAYLGTCVALTAGISIAMGSFTHLFDKNMVDMEYSLPLTADERFFAGYLSGLGMYLIPYMICQALSLILTSAGHAVIDKWLEPEQQIFADFMPIALKLIIGGLIVMLMMYTLFILTMCFCGSKFETAAYGSGANFCLPAVYVCIFITVLMNGYGLEFSLLDDSLINHLFVCTSPLGAAYGLYMSAFIGIDHAAESESFFSIYSFGFWAIKCLAVTAVLLFCALKLYRRRKAEQTGKTFISKTFYFIVMICFMMIICCGLDQINAGLAPTLIITAVVFLLMDSISNRGVKKLHISLIKYGSVMAGIFIVYAVTVNTGFFGAVNDVPEVSELKCAELLEYDGYTYGDVLNINYSFEDEQNIQTIISVHQKQLEIHNNKEKEDYADYIKIRYTYKNGTVKTRAYYINSSVREMLLPLETVDEIKAEKLEAVSNTLDCKSVYIYRNNSYDQVYNEMKFYPYEKASKLPEDFIPTLKECLRKDINNMSFDEYIDSMYMWDREPKLSIALNYTDEAYEQPKEPYYSSFRILSCYEETIKYLYSLGIARDTYTFEYSFDDSDSPDMDNNSPVVQQDLYGSAYIIY